MDTNELDYWFMKLALDYAREAAAMDETPVGALIVRDGAILATGKNLRETAKLATAHAELLAIQKACTALGGWRLPGCTLYVTLEPCPMCAGAIINARLDRVVFGAWDHKSGCAGSVTNLFLLPFNHRPQVTGGILEEESLALLQEFFRKKRGR